MKHLSDEQTAEVKQFWNWDEESLVETMLPYEQRKKIEKEITRHSVGDHPGEGLPIPFGEEVEHIVNACRVAAQALVNEVTMQVSKVACDDLQYCAQREALRGEGVGLALAIADGLVASSLQIPVPVTALSVYLVKSQILDRVCKCNEAKTSDCGSK